MAPNWLYVSLSVDAGRWSHVSFDRCRIAAFALHDCPPPSPRHNDDNRTTLTLSAALHLRTRSSKQRFGTGGLFYRVLAMAFFTSLILYVGTRIQLLCRIVCKIYLCTHKHNDSIIISCLSLSLHFQPFHFHVSVSCASCSETRASCHQAV